MIIRNVQTSSRITQDDVLGLQKNRKIIIFERTLENFIRKQIVPLKVLPLEATYLCWIDCRELELTQDRLDRLVIEEARIYVDEGHLFGPEGSGFIRLNLACPSSIVEKALQRLKVSIEKLDTGRP